MTENILTANEKYARDLGADLGRSSDAVQGEFLTGFAHSLVIACGGRLETQLAFMVDTLTPNALDTIIQLGEMAKFRKENPL